MPKRTKSTGESDTAGASGDTVTVIVKPNAPFGILAQGEIQVGKDTPVEVSSSILSHRNAEWLSIIS